MKEHSNHSIYDTLLEPAFVISSNSTVYYCNEAAAKLAGLSIKRIIEKQKLFDLFVFNDNIESLKVLEQITAPTPYRETFFINALGAEGKMQITIQPLQNCEPASWLVFCRDVTLEEQLQKKYRNELNQKESVIEALAKAKSDLELYNANLEKIVTERTFEIQSMNRNLTALLDSLNQGFFVFDIHGQILDFTSKACLSMLECRPNKKMLWEVLKTDPEQTVDLQKWIQTLFAETFPFEDFAALGPRSYPHSEDRHISLEYFPLRSDTGVLEGIVVMASDTTSLDEARQQAEQDRLFANQVLVLVQNKKNIGRFIRESQVMIHELRNQLSESIENQDPDKLFRLLHTLKGGAGLLSIGDLTQYCHEAESQLQAFKANPSLEAYLQLHASEQLISSSFDNYVETCAEVLGLASISSERQIEIPFSRFSRLVKEIENSATGQSAASLLTKEMATENISLSFKSLSDMATKLAAQQNKKVSPIEFINGDIKVVPEPYSKLFSSFIHAIRNSIDHGLELPQEREQAGKPSKGSIKITFAHNKLKKQLLIRVDDDGAGIDPKKIRAVLLKKNIDATNESDDQVIQHVFDGQLSTKDQVTEISGRGIGMDAIMNAAKSLNGNAWVISKLGKGTSLFVAVPFINTLNHHLSISAA